jgi:peptidoglycan/xylan/chitin deacetylase (PgdA/CDA1 family)
MFISSYLRLRTGPATADVALKKAAWLKNIMSQMQTGVFVVSLDFELLWGVRDHQTIEDYGQSILGARTAIPVILELFKQYDIHATWATVGFLFFDKKSDLLSGCPQLKPAYRKAELSPYHAVQHVGESETVDPYHFGKSLIELIKSYPGQEIGSHTFCHYYCQEPGQSEETFRADLVAAARAAASLGVTLRSLVFPRNQSKGEYLPACAEAGINSFRGTERSWFYRNGSRQGESKLTRAARLADAYINLSGHNTFTVQNGTGVINVPSSRFLRPYRRTLALADSMRLRRITSSIKHAAKKGEAYHLWWHPHNFGINLEENISFLRKILDYVAAMKSRYGMRSLTMSEVASG